jgi:hypothetical protein
LEKVDIGKFERHINDIVHDYEKVCVNFAIMNGNDKRDIPDICNNDKDILIKDTSPRAFSSNNLYYINNIFLRIKEHQPTTIPVNATSEDDSLDKVFCCLLQTSPIENKIITRKRMSDGTFKKEEVTIFIKNI